MNRNTWQVYLYELRRNMSRKGFLFMTFGIPAIGFLVMTGLRIFTGSPDKIVEQLQFDVSGIQATGYVDHSGAFPEPGQFVESIMARYETEAEAEMALEAGDIQVYYVIEDDYLESGRVLLVMPTFSVNLMINAEEPFDALLYGQWAQQVDLNTLLRLRSPSQLEVIELSMEAGEGKTKSEDADFVVVYAFTIIFMLAIFGTNGYLMQSVIEEKESNLVEILLSSVRPGQLLSGKILAMGTMGLFQVAVYVTAATLLSGMASNTSELAGGIINQIQIPYARIPLLLVYFVLGYLFFAGGFGAVGALSNSMSEGPNLALVFTLPAVSPLYFLIAFVNNPDGVLPVAMSLFPVTAPVAMIMRLSIASVPIGQLLVSIGLLILAVMGMFWFAGRLFRIQTLLSGQAPRFRDIPALLRG